MKSLLTLFLLFPGFWIQEPENEKSYVDYSIPEILHQIRKEANVDITLSSKLLKSSLKIRTKPDDLKGKDALKRGIDLCRLAGIGWIRITDSKKIRWEAHHFSHILKMPVRNIPSMEELPDVNEVCQMIFPLKHLHPQNAHATVLHMVTSPSAVTPVEPARALVVTDYVSNLKRIDALLKHLDARAGHAPRNEVQLKFFLVKGAGTPLIKKKTLPSLLIPFISLLEKEAPYSTYEILDVASTRVNLDPSEESLSTPYKISLAGIEGYEIHFVPGEKGPMDSSHLQKPRLGKKGLFELKKITLVHTKSSKSLRNIISTRMTLRDGERALVGASNPQSASWPLILLVELQIIP